MGAIRIPGFPVNGKLRHIQQLLEFGKVSNWQPTREARRDLLLAIQELESAVWETDYNDRILESRNIIREDPI